MRALMIASFIFAYLFHVVPLSGLWAWFRPELVILLVIYWCVYFPQQFGLVSASIVGLGLDLIDMSPLGFNVLGVLLVAYICHMVYQRVRNYVLWHQGVWAFVLVGLFQLFSNWLGGFYGRSTDLPYFLIAAFISGLLWIIIVKVIEQLLIRLRLT